MANHSATHLLSFALGNVLGDVRQRGSVVSNNNFTFDFTCQTVSDFCLSLPYALHVEPDNTTVFTLQLDVEPRDRRETLLLGSQ